MTAKLGHKKNYDRDRFEAFKMCAWRNVEKISWNDQKANEYVLDIVKEKLLKTVLERKIRWIGHILRG